MAATYTDRRRTYPLRSAQPDLDRDRRLPRVSVRREGGHAVILAWEDVTETEREGTWSVERSGSPFGGPWARVAEGLPVTQRVWRDDTLWARGREMTRRAYYRLRFSNDPLTAGEEQLVGYRPEWDTLDSATDVPGTTWEGEGVRTALTPPVAREIRQRYATVARDYTATMVAVYRPAWAEGACPACTNPRSGITVHVRVCDACMGTGFVGGFYSPFTAFMTRLGSIAAAPQPVASGGVHDLQDTLGVVFPAWPIPEAGDFIRTREGFLYVIAASTPEDLYGYPVLHQASLTQVSREHRLNTVPMPSRLFDTPPGPWRQLARATSPQAWAKSREHGSANTGPVRDDE